MIDWTNPAAGDAWHDLKRAPLAAMGIHSHWIDLGEPEMYAKDACYHGHPTLGNRHWDVHNVYNLFWAASIWRGYERSRSTERPFIAARSGAAGIQRYGVGIWSGDIGGSLRALSGHLRAQAHMSWSGVDYYTSDIGGFHRKDEGWRELSQEAVAQNYTIWFANGMMFDYPARPHVWNMDLGARGQKQGKSTAPTRVGHGASNLANARLRYELSPYVYTQAWRAATTGAPLLPPLALAFPTDMAARSLGDVKMLGEDLLVGVIANADVVAREVHLPAGRWIDWHSLEAVDSRGQLSRPVPVARDGLLRLPIFARAGAIVPTLRVDDRTLNVLGQRSAPGAPHLVSSETASAFRVRVFTDPKETNYTHYEDDGISTAHRDGRYRTTGVKQSRMGSLATVTISGADDHGASYLGAPNTRARVVELASPGEMAAGVKVNGSALAACPQGVDPEDATAACYVNVRAGLAKAAVSAAPVGEEITFAFTLAPDVPERAAGPVTLVCRDARTAPGEAIYVVGSVPALGAWDPAKAIALKTFDAIYPHWAVQVDGLPPGVEFEWKCFKAKEDGASTWQISADPKAAVLEWSDGNAKGTSTPEAHDLYSKKF
jgi:alpha-glucosidase